jgi:phosphate transport system substrate-binding protein
MSRQLRSIAAAIALALFAGCGEKEEPDVQRSDDVPSNEEQLAERLSGTIRIDGPRVLAPLSNAAAENFEVETPVKVDVEESGTETAFAKLCTGRIAVAGARREMTGSERAVCDKRGIEVQRLKIANHAVTVATSEELNISCLTTGQLEELWRPGSTVTRYSQLGAGLPATTIELYGPQTTNDAFALFTSLINGQAGAIRSEWRSVVNRSALTGRLRDSRNALGFYNLAQLTPVTDISLVAVDGGDGCIEPTETNVQSGRYPLRENLYLYVSRPRLGNLRLRSFLQYVAKSYPQLAATAPSVVPATDEEIAEAARGLPAAQSPSG